MTLSELLLANEANLRMSFFLGVFFLLAIAEACRPRRKRDFPRSVRWVNNLSLVVLDSLLLKICFPLLAVGMAYVAQQRSWGLFNLLDMPIWVEAGFCILLLDLAIYAQHVLFHLVPPLWRLHRVHHTDMDFDLTTGIRFHPLEILLSMAIKLILVVSLGAPVIAVLIFEILLNASAMFNHSNLNLPLTLDRLLRKLIVTPDMHRVHHSVYVNETNSNYGFFLSFWDRLFSTYIDQPQDGHQKMRLGLEYFRQPRDLRLDKLLLQPLRPGRTPSSEGKKL